MTPVIIGNTTRSHSSGEVRSFDHVELFVGNVHQAAHFYQTVWGFEPIARHGLDVGSGDRVSMILGQGTIRLVLTGATSSSSPVAEHLRLHGEGVASVGFSVDDVERAFDFAVARGAPPVMDPVRFQNDDGVFVYAKVRSLGSVTHTLVDRNRYCGVFWPGFRQIESTFTAPSTFDALDHIAMCVEHGSLEDWVEFYQSVFGFSSGRREDVATEYSGMNSRLVQNVSATCKIPLVEPALGKQKSQVSDFLGFHGGPGVQHLAVLTPSILIAVRRLQEHGVEFLSIPDSYYETLESRIGKLPSDLAGLREYNVLIDRDESGYLLQTFTRSTHDRPSMFFEIVERRGGQGFGAGNIRALFEALEREQAMRGKL